MSASDPSRPGSPRPAPSGPDRPVHTLTVLLPELGLEALIVDAQDRIVARSGGHDAPEPAPAADGAQDRIVAELPRGLYVLRTSRSGVFIDTPVRLDGPKTITAEPPPLFSAATVPGAQTTHEYYTYPAWELSHRPTAPACVWNGPAEAQLLLFVRAPEMGVYTDRNQLAGLRLCTPQGETLTRFDDAEVARHNDGWSAYSVALSPGLLILEDGGGQAAGVRPRQLPVPLWPGWQTQLFVMHTDRPLWEDMRVSAVPLHALASRSERSPYDDDAEDVRAGLDVDAGLLALQNGVGLAAPRLVRAFLYSKFQNPVLGLLGAYLLLLRAQRDRAKAGRDAPDGGPVDLMRNVLENLSALLPQSADVAALRLMATPWLGPPPVHPVEQVPLFREGAEVLLAAAAGEPAWLPEGSLLDAVSDRLYADTVWASWESVPLPVGAAREAPGGVDDAGGPAEVTDWVEAAVVDAIVAAERRDKPVPPEALVRSIGVSPRVVREAMGRLVARAAQPAAPTPVAIRTSRVLGSRTSRALARTVGAPADDGLLESIREQADRIAAAMPGPNIRRVYADLKKVLAGYVDTDTGRISADSVLDDLLPSAGSGGRRQQRRKLVREFGDLDLGLSGEELDQVDTVRDLAQLIQKRGVE